VRGSTAVGRGELAGRHSARSHGQAEDACSGGGEEGVGDGGRESHDSGFAGAGRGQILAVEEHNLDVRYIAEVGDAVAGEVALRIMPEVQ
jgi:hypothetical protein